MLHPTHLYVSCNRGLSELLGRDTVGQAPVGLGEIVRPRINLGLIKIDCPHKQRHVWARSALQLPNWRRIRRCRYSLIRPPQPACPNL